MTLFALRSETQTTATEARRNRSATWTNSMGPLWPVGWPAAHARNAPPQARLPHRRVFTPTCPRPPCGCPLLLAACNRSRSEMPAAAVPSCTPTAARARQAGGTGNRKRSGRNVRSGPATAALSARWRTGRCASQRPPIAAVDCWRRPRSCIAKATTPTLVAAFATAGQDGRLTQRCGWRGAVQSGRALPGRGSVRRGAGRT